MAEHHLDDSVTQPFWDNSIEPRLEIAPGDLVEGGSPAARQCQATWREVDQCKATWRKAGQ